MHKPGIAPETAGAPPAQGHETIRQHNNNAPHANPTWRPHGCCMPFWRLHTPRTACPALLLALGLLLPGATSAQGTPPTQSAATTLAWPSPTAATAASFSEVATVDVSMSTAHLTAPTPTAEHSVSPWWLALPLPGLAVWALRRRKPNRRAADDDNDTAPAGWAITRWMQGHQSDARGWRLSRFEELAEPDFSPLYGSLDDQELPSVDNVVPLHRSSEAQTPRPRRAHASHHKTDVIDIEARLVPKAR